MFRLQRTSPTICPLSRVSACFVRRQVAVSQPHVEQLFATQANLELRVARSLSFGRWLWRGVNFSELWATEAFSGCHRPGESGSGGGKCFDLAGPSVPQGGTALGNGRGVWVPWETEAANASPECLRVSGRRGLVEQISALFRSCMI